MEERRGCSKRLQCFMAGLLFFAFATGALLGQTATTAAITGTVKDTTGAVLPGVAVVATNPDTGLERSVLSGEDGTYRFALLPSGSYKVRFSLDGFKTSEASGVVLTVT